MNPGLNIWKCRGCGKLYFPERFLCAACGSPDFDRAEVNEGRAEEVTIVSHVIGQESWKPRPIVTVKVDDGPRILAGGLEEISEGDRVEIFHEEAVPYVKRRAG